MFSKLLPLLNKWQNTFSTFTWKIKVHHQHFQCPQVFSYIRKFSRVSIMDTEVSKWAQTYKEIAGIPSVVAAKILPGIHDNITCIHTLWSSQDFVKFEKNVFSRDYVIEKESLKALSTGISSDISSVHLCAFSKSGKRRAILREKKSPEEKLYLEIWNESRKEATFDMNERKEHGKICENDSFKCFEWSSDEKFLLYAAEEKQPKSVSYFKDSSPNKEEAEIIVKGEEFAYKEEWGEACVGIHHTVLCLLEIETGTIEVLPTSKIGTDISFGQAKWGPNNESIIFGGWNESPYRLGVWACRNRRSALYSMDLKSKDTECLTSDKIVCVRSPSFSPNFDTLIYLESSEGGPHFKGAKLMKYDMKTKKHSTVVDLVDGVVGNEFPGIYADRLPSRCWSDDGKFVYFSSIWRSNLVIICVDISNGQVHKIEVGKEFGASTVLDVQYNIIVADMSSPNTEPCLAVGHIDLKNKTVKDWKFLDGNAPVKHSDINWEIMKLTPNTANNTYPNLDYDIVVLRPEETQKKCPMIVLPHGGPHSCYVAGFPFRTIGFVKLGYVVCLVNYRGSIGFGENSIKSLLGNIGTQDVGDVQQAALHIKNNSNFNIGDVFAFGGSHGGFLGAHLCGQYPDFYKAGVLLNPVTDISSMVGVTDIPDWTWVEAGLGDFNSSVTVTPDNLKVMWEKSPIRYLENVRAPILLLLGKKDLRVPFSQGLKYYQLLQARNIPVRLYQYEDNHQLLKTPHDGDVFMQTILWFNKHLSF